jgi:hypothetical protein
MKVVINRCYGGFGLSHDAIVRYCALKGLNLTVVEKEKSFAGQDFDYYLGSVCDENYWYDGQLRDSARADPALVQTVEELGERANGWAAELAVIEIPDGVAWHIAEYDGIEHVAEDHSVWY